MSGAFAMKHLSGLAGLAALALLAGCVSLGGAEPPAQLLTLTPSAAQAAGAVQEGAGTSALAVEVPRVDARLNVTRIPVSTSSSALAYLVDAVWVDRPARLFRNVLAETLRARGQRLVLDDEAVNYGAATRLSGTLLDMGYDAPSQSVVVRYDALLAQADGQVRTRRFEARVAGVAPEANAVGAALNVAANQVAGEVTDWVN